MSAKCCLTESTMLISLISHPRSSMSLWEFPFVLPVVPKPGMVIPIRVFDGSPRFFTAWADTRSARVESSPPDTPTTMQAAWVASSLLSRPATCILNMDFALSSLLCPGTNGVMDTLARISSLSGKSRSHFTVIYLSSSTHCFLLAAKLLFAILSCLILARLMSFKRLPSSKGFTSPRSLPFS